jgi:DNA polymerase elongation subunit (family B)
MEERILYLDIETVPGSSNYQELPERVAKLWDKKAAIIGRNDPDLTPEDLYERAGIYAEFGKIVCISTGYMYRSKEGEQFRVTSFSSDDELELLTDFSRLLNRHFNDLRYHRLCAHNGKEFDFPFIARRMLVHRISLPDLLNLQGKKPWEIPHIDTMEMWKFGDYKNFTSLDLLSALFDLPTPKDDIDGSQIYQVYYGDNDLDRIVKYCEKDVVALARVHRRLSGMPDFGLDQVVAV